ncbi:MAG: hypothetical protein HUJ22_13325 [Gracilimonas sp.]|uniref:hypothetical protein n=1 Tax=Gracilimonas sp. TaxID=1974203 RepID=UPI001986FBC8|nr:hypothetical protein [Gracilimonas sp.]MBD3617540.1 hypothetical protein [Gracilimonas sp.]
MPRPLSAQSPSEGRLRVNNHPCHSEQADRQGDAAKNLHEEGNMLFKENAFTTRLPSKGDPASPHSLRAG